MQTHIPAAADVRSRLVALSHAQMQALARDSGVPFTTLWKIRSGETADPRIDTVRQLYAVIAEFEATTSGLRSISPDEAKAAGVVLKDGCLLRAGAKQKAEA